MSEHNQSFNAYFDYMSNPNNSNPNQLSTIHNAIENYRAKLIALGAPEQAVDLGTVSFITGVIEAAKVVQQFNSSKIAALAMLTEVDILRHKYAPDVVKQAANETAAAADEAEHYNNDLDTPPAHEKN